MDFLFKLFNSVDFYLVVIFVVAGATGIFFLLREAVCWYLKQNRVIDLLESIDHSLKILTSSVEARKKKLAAQKEALKQEAEKAEAAAKDGEAEDDLEDLEKSDDLEDYPEPMEPQKAISPAVQRDFDRILAEEKVPRRPDWDYSTDKCAQCGRPIKITEQTYHKGDRILCQSCYVKV